MDWEKGVKRFALVLAVFVGVLHCVLFIAYGGGWLDRFFDLIRLKRGSTSNDLLALLLVFLIGFLPVWGIPSAICWAIKGFRDDNTARNKSQQNPTAQGQILNALSGFTRDLVKSSRRGFEDIRNGVEGEVGIDSARGGSSILTIDYWGGGRFATLFLIDFRAGPSTALRAKGWSVVRANSLATFNNSPT